jgi:hypothetical protein
MRSVSACAIRLMAHLGYLPQAVVLTQCRDAEVGDRVTTEGGTNGVVGKLFPNGGSALVKPDREELPLILLSREKVTRIDDPGGA